METPYSYQLPRERIASRPIEPADAAKLLVVSRGTESLQESRFCELDNFLTSGDLLIFNKTRVIPARFFGRTESFDSEVEILLTRIESDFIATALGRPLKKLKTGVEIILEDKSIFKVLERVSSREIRIQLIGSESFDSLTKKQGSMPIPPYIREGRGDAQDISDYQNPFGVLDGSVAAPTASLHFTESLLSRVEAKGIERDYCILHVGPPSFLPLDEECGELRPPGSEELSVANELLEKIKEVKLRGNRVIAVGTTVARALESAARGINDGETELFIQSGFEFKILDALITNFHQPGTTHLLLVEALMGRCLLQSSYELALKNNFRFLSYGDGMLIL